MREAVINYTDTTSPEAVETYIKKWSRDKQREYNWKRRRRTAVKQKIAGLILLAITIPAVRMLNGDATIAVMTIPVGIGLILSAKEEIKDV